MTTARRIVHFAALGVILCWLAGCGPTAREKTIATTLAAVQVSEHAFLAYDNTKQDDIIAHATTKADGEAQLATWRQEQTKVAQMLSGAYRAVAIAATVNTDVSLSSMVQAALILAQELHALKVLP